MKVHGNMKYLYALMDDETRFRIAKEVADTKYTADVTPLFREAKALAGKAPTTLTGQDKWLTIIQNASKKTD